MVSEDLNADCHVETFDKTGHFCGQEREASALPGEIDKLWLCFPGVNGSPYPGPLAQMG